MSFFSDWFGSHAGREVLVLEPFKDLVFLEKPEQLEAYIKECREKRLPAYMSAQPFSARDQPFGIEKLFFEFDCEGDVPKAWKDTRIFASALKKYYEVEPFIKFSGRKGYHVDAFLARTVQFPTWRTEFVKEVYEKLQRKILKGLHLETLDPNVIGDIKRLERIPYSVHEKSDELCQPIDLDGNPLTLRSLEFYRNHGLETKLLETICKEIKVEEEFRKVLSNRRKRLPKISAGIRPCVETALSLPLHKGEGHKMRLAIALEFLNNGFSSDQVVSLFSSQAVFNASKTRYYVEYALRKNYRPFECRTIRELGFCLGDSCPRRK